VRPFAGASIAVVHHRIDTDGVIPDDFDEDNETRQELRSHPETAVGYVFSFGGEINLSNTVVAEAGTRYMKSFSVPHSSLEKGQSM
jgi:opacity protein-like surface antigen